MSRKGGGVQGARRARGGRAALGGSSGVRPSQAAPHTSPSLLCPPPVSGTRPAAAFRQPPPPAPTSRPRAEASPTARLLEVLPAEPLDQVEVDAVPPPLARPRDRRRARRRRQPQRRLELLAQLQRRPLARRSVHVERRGVGGADGDHPRGGVGRARVQAGEDAPRARHVAPRCEHAQPLARQHRPSHQQLVAAEREEVRARLGAAAQHLAHRRVGRRVEEQADRPAGCVMLQHQHDRPVHQRLLDDNVRVRLREQ
mmetsp:Transcript_45397/g.151419  ORF Transcript_45397/g.151419 Transcript_45397/m.151419 type:complete len:256 (+) Transcript_45397:3604-4371(+)